MHIFNIMKFKHYVIFLESAQTPLLFTITAFFKNNYTNNFDGCSDRVHFTDVRN